MRYEPHTQAASIVLIGKFNPAIVSPAWLSKMNLIKDSELQDAKVQIIHPEVAQFSLEPLGFEVFQNRFRISITLEPFVRILDLTLAMFAEMLPHTPVDKVGINYEVHFSLQSFEQRVALGRELAPLTPWGMWGKQVGQARGDKTGGLASLTLREVDPPAREHGARNVKIEPSTKKDPRRDVFMHINDHYDLPESNDKFGTLAAMDILRTRFDVSLNESKSIVSSMMDYAARFEK